MHNSYLDLQPALGYQFQQPDLLQLALTHRSHNGTHNNERMEFLGDSILNFIIGEALFEQFPDAREGQLSRLRASLVKGVYLTRVAKQLGLGPYILLGPGELKSGGSRRDSILADAVEAIIGAMYLDAGMPSCKRQVLEWYADRLKTLSLEDTTKDNKTRLQEWLQSRKLALPGYEIVDIGGQSHSQHFEVECTVSERGLVFRGKGQSRRQAEQIAAGKMLAELENAGNQDATLSIETDPGTDN
ncbi:MAG: ribonuclease III [Ketobacter sp.]|nr:MAG: ribonuclease III [Ketobacter sp.]